MRLRGGRTRGKLAIWGLFRQDKAGYGIVVPLAVLQAARKLPWHRWLARSTSSTRWGLIRSYLRPVHGFLHIRRQVVRRSHHDLAVPK
jgi:hypothetical protein